jgi:uncharacterized membrane protein YuzA (DUF378 family)
MNKEVNLIADAIVYAVQNQKSQVLGLLLKNGVIIPTGTSDAKIIVAVSDTFKKSKPFRKEFINLISQTEYVSSSSFDGYANVVGNNGFTYDASFDPITSIFGTNTTTTTTNTKPKTTSADTKSASTSFWSTENIMSLINKGADVYTATTTNQANTALANAAKARAEAGITDSASTEKDSTGTNNDNKKTTETSPVVYVVVGIAGVALVGGLIWYFTKSKK